MKFSVNFGGETEPLGGEIHPAGLYADKPLLFIVVVTSMKNNQYILIHHLKGYQETKPQILGKMKGSAT